MKQDQQSVLPRKDFIRFSSQECKKRIESLGSKLHSLSKRVGDEINYGARFVIFWWH